VDKNGNALTFTYTRTSIGNRNTGVLTSITDPASRQTLTFDYFRPGDNFAFFVNNVKQLGKNLTNSLIINQLRSVTDVSGRRITFTYSDHGLLQEVADAAGTPQEKDFDFFYDDGTLLTNPKLIRINDPLGHGTQIAYFGQDADQLHRARVQTITDRTGAVTGFEYAAVDPKSGNALREAVTDPNGHATNFTIDQFGRAGVRGRREEQTTGLTWDADNNVVRMQENNKAVTTWTYDPGTGYPLEITDAEQKRPRRGVHRPELPDLPRRPRRRPDREGQPEGRKWTFRLRPGRQPHRRSPIRTATPRCATRPVQPRRTPTTASASSELDRR